MPARPPHRGLKQPLSPPDGEEPSARAELHFVKIPADRESPAIPSQEQVIPAIHLVNRIITMLRHVELGAALRIAVPSGDASQMLTTIERITITLIWAVTVTSTLVITIAAGLPAAAVFAIIAAELAGFVITLFATRWRRHKKELYPRLLAVEGLGTPDPPGPLACPVKCPGRNAIRGGMPSSRAAAATGRSALERHSSPQTSATRGTPLPRRRRCGLGCPGRGHSAGWAADPCARRSPARRAGSRLRP